MNILQPEAVIRYKTSCLGPSCNSVSPCANLPCRDEQERSDAAVADESKYLNRCSETSRHDENSQNTEIPPQTSKSSTRLEIMAETKNTFSSSPIKYVLSYRGRGGIRFKDEVVQHMESLEPMSQNQREWIFEVNRIVIMEEMHIDSTKPLTEQSISIQQYGPCEIKINSMAIINALNRVVNYWPGLNLNTPSLIIQEPFAIFYHHRKDLKEYADSASSALTRKNGEGCEREQTVGKDLKLLFDFLDLQPIAKKIASERERHNRSKPAATFEMLWMLFPPGTDVFLDSSEGGSYEGFVVQQTSGGGLAMDRASPFTITLWYLNYNGQYIGRSVVDSTIQPFTGEKEVNSLPIIPCNLYKRVTAGQVSDESKALQQTFVGYGQKFLELTKRQCVQYSGETYSFPRRSVCKLEIETYLFKKQKKKKKKKLIVRLVSKPSYYRHGGSVL